MGSDLPQHTQPSFLHFRSRHRPSAAVEINADLDLPPTPQETIKPGTISETIESRENAKVKKTVKVSMLQKQNPSETFAEIDLVEESKVNENEDDSGVEPCTSGQQANSVAARLRDYVGGPEHFTYSSNING
ncbi:unnamed protein product [Dibothriocephalus latus]|uniref:Uncharacterized protein n=1 Tax=Dibothriocephalus latus TaxID=60516 RepID=A0A3P7NVA9_DIBLA|nr:unnamed protein product [Dibothriocephalus latus]